MIKLGLYMLNYERPGEKLSFERFASLVQKAESLGFDSVWITDHIVLGSKRVFPYLESLTTLAALSAKTSKIKLGVCTLVLPLREPVLLARTVSTLNMISNGRITLCVAGGWYKREFKACGADYTRRGHITEERLVLLRKLLSEDDINLNVGTTQLEHVTILPHAKIPVLMGGYGPKTLSRVGRFSDGWIPTSYPPDAFNEAWKTIVSHAGQAGRDINTLDNGDLIIGCVDRTSAEARVRKFASVYLDEIPWSKADHVKSAVAGSPDACVEKIKEYEKAGAKNLIITPCDFEEEQIDLIAKEILPHFR